MKLNITYINQTLIISILIILLFTLVCNSQVVIKNTKLIDQNKRILYIGIDNEIKIEGINFNYDIIFKNSSTKIIKSATAENEYYIQANKKGKDTLQIIRGNQIIFETEYSIQHIGDPICYFNDIEAEFVKRKDIISNPFISCNIPNNLLKLDFNIVSFRISSIELKDTIELYDTKDFFRADTIEVTDTITGENQVRVRMKKSDFKYNHGNKLTEFQIDKIKNLKIGDLIFISDIHVIFPDGINRMMNNIMIKIR